MELSRAFLPSSISVALSSWRKHFRRLFQDSKAAPGWISQLDGSKEDLPEIRLGLAKVLAPLPLCEAGW
jgi:hypothetical protein